MNEESNCSIQLLAINYIIYLHFNEFNIKKNTLLLLNTIIESFKDLYIFFYIKQAINFFLKELYNFKPIKLSYISQLVFFFPWSSDRDSDPRPVQVVCYGSVGRQQCDCAMSSR